VRAGKGDSWIKVCILLPTTRAVEGLDIDTDKHLHKLIEILSHSAIF